MPELLRAAIFHTPKNAFDCPTGLTAIEDGALAVSGPIIAACGDYSEVRAAYLDAPVRDLRGSWLLPGFIDTHIHFPQVRILGGLGYSLHDWLESLTLPEEARLADVNYASLIAGEFVRNLAAQGTTTALVFGAHFAEATSALFDASAAAGLRVFSGLVLSDRMLRPELHQTPEAAYEASELLIGKYGAAYAVIPRFALSASEPMLEVCSALLRQHAGLRFTTHINESVREVEEVARLFPWARDYLAVYERYALAGRRSVFAHNVQTDAAQLQRMAAHDCAVAHCPASNAALGSGIFPMRRHLEAGVRFALGTDVAAGIGFGMAKEALQAHLMQRVAGDPLTLTPAQMLYLATRAGAEALDLDSETGDFGAGKSADFVLVKPEAGSALAGVLGNLDDPERRLGAILSMLGPESIREVRVKGVLVHGTGLTF